MADLNKIVEEEGEDGGNQTEVECFPTYPAGYRNGKLEKKGI